tara:strand:+ start:1331 stop:1897 length:567 start_codon:yes stop_codon:yes gene_type:complete
LNFKGTYNLKEEKEKVWKILNDPNTLRICIEGCSAFTEESENNFSIKLQIKLGPINANFSAKIRIFDINKTDSYKIEGSGNAGSLGYVSGIVSVELRKIDEFVTELSYNADTKISGKIAQLGSRLLDGSVKKNTDRFFLNLQSAIEKRNEYESSVLKITEKGEFFSSLKSTLFLFTIAIMLLLIIVVG